mgnify:CR=1 FL=1
MKLTRAGRVPQKCAARGEELLAPCMVGQEAPAGAEGEFSGMRMCVWHDCGCSCEENSRHGFCGPLCPFLPCGSCLWSVWVLAGRSEGAPAAVVGPPPLFPPVDEWKSGSSLPKIAQLTDSDVELIKRRRRLQQRWRGLPYYVEQNKPKVSGSTKVK